MPGIFNWSATPSSNTVIDGINVAENCPASGINNAIRSVAAIVRQSFSSGLENFLAGTSPLALTSGGTGLSAALTTNALVKQGASAFTQSIISDDGSTVTVGGNVNAAGYVSATNTTTAPNVLFASSGQTGTTARSNIVARLQTTVAGRDVALQFSDNVSNAAEIGMVGGAFYTATAGVVRTWTDATGNTGFNVTSPAARVDVGGSAAVSDGSFFFTPYNGSTNTGTVRAGIQCDGTNQIINFHTASGSRMSLNASGVLNLPGNLTVGGTASITGALSAASLALSTALALAQGGTGSTTAAGARTNLGAQQAMTVTTNANGTAFGFTIGSTTYYLQCMPVGALGVNGSTTLTYPVALTTSVLVALADKYVSGPINDGLNLGAGAPGLTSMTVVNGGTAMSGGYALVIGY